jgi:hypothetical protein
MYNLQISDVSVPVLASRLRVLTVLALSPTTKTLTTYKPLPGLPFGKKIASKEEVAPASSVKVLVSEEEIVPLAFKEEVQQPT